MEKKSSVIYFIESWMKKAMEHRKVRDFGNSGSVRPFEFSRKRQGRRGNLGFPQSVIPHKHALKLEHRGAAEGTVTQEHSAASFGPGSQVGWGRELFSGHPDIEWEVSLLEGTDRG